MVRSSHIRRVWPLHLPDQSIKLQKRVPRACTHLAAEARVGGLLVHPVLRQQLTLLVRGRLLVRHLVDPRRGDLHVAEVALRACRVGASDGGLGVVGV